MKMMNKRSKILFGIGALVLVAVVAGLVLLGPGDSLFGGTIIHISPANPTINVGQYLDMSINSMFICKWTSSNEGMVEITEQDPNGTRHITVYGYGPGTATIKANCVIDRTTQVTVRTPPRVTYNPPPNASGVVVLHVGQSVTASVGSTGTNCTWAIACGQRSCSYDKMHAVTLTPTTGQSTTITGAIAGEWTTVIPTCDNGRGTGYASINVLQ